MARKGQQEALGTYTESQILPQLIAHEELPNFSRKPVIEKRINNKKVLISNDFNRDQITTQQSLQKHSN